MFVHRIGNTKHIRDLSGFGARIKGGRWNRPGTGVIYTSENRSLAILEFRAHLTDPKLIPAKSSILTIQISPKIVPKKIPVSKLPQNWQHFPWPSVLADIGTEWVNTNGSLLLSVPSVITPHEFNILINPSHPDIKHIKIYHIEPYEFDNRILS